MTGMMGRCVFCIIKYHLVYNICLSCSVALTLNPDTTSQPQIVCLFNLNLHTSMIPSSSFISKFFSWYSKL